MFNLLGFGAWLRIGACAAVLALLGWSHFTAYQRGREAVLSQLQDDRITVLKDGARIDNEALTADDDNLCRLLGGCSVPDDPNGN